MSYVKSIPVRDESGADLTLHEFQERRFLRKVRRWKLDTGELVEEVRGRLVIAATGERLERVSSE